MNGINVYDGNQHLPSSVDAAADNAKVIVKFGSGASQIIAGPLAFDEYDVQGEAAKYFNDHFRSYGVMEQVDTFVVLGLGGSQEIPEPSSIALAVFALGSVVSLRRVRKRST
jgi:hypothetical protein